MKCPNADKLSQVHDQLLSNEEMEQLQAHVNNCASCQVVIELFEGETDFMKETLQTPTLPNEFAGHVLEQLTPYKPLKRRKSYWKRALLSAAGVALAFGVTVAVSPSFAQLIGGIFSTDSVDEGLQMAMDAGLVERVDLSVVDKGITLKVEDVMVDSSRLVISYQILNSSGKVLDPYFDMQDKDNHIFLVDAQGNELEPSISSWGRTDEDYGLLQYSLREGIDVEKFTVQVRLHELARKKGMWHLDIPIELSEITKLTTKVALNDATFEHEGVTVTLQEAQYAPSSNELIYTTSFTNETRTELQEKRDALTEQYGEQFNPLTTGVGYYIENQSGERVAANNIFTVDRGHSVSNGTLQSLGSRTDIVGQSLSIDSFVPRKENDQLTFVLEGIYKTIQLDYAVSFQPDKIENESPSFDYGGNYLTIKSIEKETDYSLRKSWLPIQKDSYVVIVLEGSREAMADDLENWVLQDDKGNSYMAYRSGGTSDNIDEHGRFLMTVELRVYGVEKITDTMTLHLTQVNRYEQLTEPWRVPLYQ
ncbi:DUF4179 domain-containing protein [Solibacillus sp. FSL H8-0538]|uniref:DUF4179 domain-containing protein n=1 Tax=Solibacillus sp. FSL H8-0538 TaxID=2921400 RepID=UPI0030F5EBCE